MQFSIDYLFADACVCGKPRDDETFCFTCRSQHENLLSQALASLPNQISADICKNCGEAHPTYRCPEIWAMLRAGPEIDVCVSCGDDLGRPGPGICSACVEAGELAVAA